MFLIWLSLLPQMQAFKHRLSRGCDNCAMLRVVRMMGRKQPYISLPKEKKKKRIDFCCIKAFEKALDIFLFFSNYFLKVY